MKKRLMLAGIAVLGCVMSVGTSSQADDYPAWLNPLVFAGGSQSCIYEAYGQIHDTCTATITLDVLSIDTVDNGQAYGTFAMWSDTTVQGKTNASVNGKSFDYTGSEYASTGWIGGGMCSSLPCNGIETSYSDLGFVVETGHYFYMSVSMTNNNVINSFEFDPF